MKLAKSSRASQVPWAMISPVAASGRGVLPTSRRGLGEDDGGEGELGELMAQVADLLSLRGDTPVAGSQPQ
jgi:hypothetical protein